MHAVIQRHQCLPPPLTRSIFHSDYLNKKTLLENVFFIITSFFQYFHNKYKFVPNPWGLYIRPFKTNVTQRIARNVNIVFSTVIYSGREIGQS